MKNGEEAMRKLIDNESSDSGRSRKADKAAASHVKM